MKYSYLVRFFFFLFFFFPAPRYYTLSLLSANYFNSQIIVLAMLRGLPFYNALTVTPILLDPATTGITFPSKKGLFEAKLY